MKTVFSSTDNFQIELLKGLLTDSGVESYILNEHSCNVLPYSAAIQSMHIQLVVNDNDYQKALDIINPNNNNTVTKCPFCDSNNITFGLKGRNKNKKLFAAILSFITMGMIGNVKCNYYCNDCKEEF